MILDSVSVPCHFNSKKLPNSSSENKDVSLHLGVKLGERENHYLSFKANEHRLKAEGWEDNFSLVKGLPAAGIVSMIRAGEVDVVQFNANLPKRDLKKPACIMKASILARWCAKSVLTPFTSR